MAIKASAYTVKSDILLAFHGKENYGRKPVDCCCAASKRICRNQRDKSYIPRFVEWCWNIPFYIIHPTYETYDRSPIDENRPTKSTTQRQLATCYPPAASKQHKQDPDPHFLLHWQQSIEITLVQEFHRNDRTCRSDCSGSDIRSYQHTDNRKALASAPIAPTQYKRKSHREHKHSRS